MADKTLPSHSLGCSLLRLDCPATSTPSPNLPYFAPPDWARLLRSAENLALPSSLEVGRILPTMPTSAQSRAHRRTHHLLVPRLPTLNSPSSRYPRLLEQKHVPIRPSPPHSALPSARCPTPDKGSRPTAPPILPTRSATLAHSSGLGRSSRPSSRAVHPLLCPDLSRLLLLQK